MKSFYEANKPIIWAAVIAVVLTIGILIKVPDEVTRFTLIMPIFAGFILFSILITAEDDLENEDEKSSSDITEPEKHAEKKSSVSKKKSPKRNKKK